MKLTILFILTALNTWSQPEVWRKYIIREGFCGVEFTLYNDSTYIYETGCEGRSHVNFGKWILKNKFIELHPVDTARFEFIQSISLAESSRKDSTSEIKIVDRFDRPIAFFNLLLVPSETTFEILENGSLIFVSGTKSSSKPEYIHTNEEGKISKLILPNCSLFLYHLTNVFSDKKVLNIPIAVSHDVEIKLNLDSELFKYPELTWLNLEFLRLKNDPKEIRFIVE